MEESALIKGEEKNQVVNEIANDPARLETLWKLMDYSAGASMYPNTADGFINDLHEYIKPINFEGITVPTLVIHGNMDGDIPFSQV